MSITNKVGNEPDAPNATLPGSAGAAPAVSGASPETSRGIRYNKRRLPHFERPWTKFAVTFSTIGRHHLNPRERDVVLKSVLYGFERGQYQLFVACIMPDHVHLLLEPQPKQYDDKGGVDFWSLTEILQGIKSSTAHRINKLRTASGAVWEAESFDRFIRSERDLQQKFEYICRNPWEAKLVSPIENYPWLWTEPIGSARAPNRAGEGACAPRTPGSTGGRHEDARILT